jgi:hypothetical protein
MTEKTWVPLDRTPIKEVNLASFKILERRAEIHLSQWNRKKQYFENEEEFLHARNEVIWALRDAHEMARKLNGLRQDYLIYATLRIETLIKEEISL